MPVNRFFIDDDFAIHESITLTGREHYHMYRVMRKKAGETVEIVNGRGDYIEATLKDIDENTAELIITKVVHYPEPVTQLCLIQGIPNIVRLEILLEKCTELGCQEFLLYFSSNSERRLFSEQKKERLRYITISALKQCGSYYLPKLKWFEKIEDVPRPQVGPVFFGDLRHTAPTVRSSEMPCTFINGPESGFTHEEIDYFESVWNAKGISIHHHVLRTETAAIAATTLFSFRN